MDSRLAENTASAILSADAVLWANLALGYQDATFQSIYMQALLPFGAMYAWESTNVLGIPKETIQSFFGEAADYVTSTRHRAKLLDDERDFDQILSASERIMLAEREFFYAPYQRTRDFWRRWLVTDLGILWHDNRPVATSLSTLLSIERSGMALPVRADLPTMLFQFGHAIGQLTSNVLSAMNTLVDDVIVQSYAPEIRRADFKSKQFLLRSQKSISTTDPITSLVLLAIECYVNSALLLAPEISSSNALAAMKLQVVCLYHARSSVNRIIARNRENDFLHPRAETALSEVLRHESLRANKRTRDLRNALVHYRVLDKHARRLDSELPFNGLVEAHVPNTTATALADETVDGLRVLSDCLHELLFPKPVITSSL